MHMLWCEYERIDIIVKSEFLQYMCVCMCDELECVVQSEQAMMGLYKMESIYECVTRRQHTWSSVMWLLIGLYTDERAEIFHVPTIDCV